jgi:hypothetical protein
MRSKLDCLTQVIPQLITNFRIAHGCIFSPVARKMQARVWKEIVGILVEAAPEVEKLVSL